MRISNAPGRVNKRRLRVYKYLTSQMRSLERVMEDGDPSVDVNEYKRVVKERAIIEHAIVSEETALSTKRKIYRGAR